MRKGAKVSKGASFDDGETQQPVRRTGGRSAVHRGVSLRPEEDLMLTALMRYDNPRAPHRSEAMGNMIRAMYEQMIAAGQLAQDEAIPAATYEGWSSRWGLQK